VSRNWLATHLSVAETGVTSDEDDNDDDGDEGEEEEEVEAVREGEVVVFDDDAGGAVVYW